MYLTNLGVSINYTEINTQTTINRD